MVNSMMATAPVDVRAPIGVGVVSDRGAFDLTAGALAANTRVRTPNGSCTVSALKAGDLVHTQGAGPQPVIWRSPIVDLALVRWCLNGSVPPVSGTRRQRVVVAGDQVRHLCGAPHALARIGDLAPTADVIRAPAVFLLLQGQELMDLGGIWAESLDLHDALCGGLPRDLRDLLLRACPRLRHTTGQAAYLEPCPVLDRSEAALLS